MDLTVNGLLRLMNFHSPNENEKKLTRRSHHMTGQCARTFRTLGQIFLVYANADSTTMQLILHLKMLAANCEM
jgi:hypothetical protein